MSDHKMTKGFKVISAWTPDGNSGWIASSSNIVSMETYAENGEMAGVPYLRIVFTDGSEVRASCEHYEVRLAALDGEEVNDE